VRLRVVRGLGAAVVLEVRRRRVAGVVETAR